MEEGQEHVFIQISYSDGRFGYTIIKDDKVPSGPLPWPWGPVVNWPRVVKIEKSQLERWEEVAKMDMEVQLELMALDNRG